MHRTEGGMVGPAEAVTFDNAVDRGARACTRTAARVRARAVPRRARERATVCERSAWPPSATTAWRPRWRPPPFADGARAPLWQWHWRMASRQFDACEYDFFFTVDVLAASRRWWLREARRSARTQSLARGRAAAQRPPPFAAGARAPLWQWHWSGVTPI